MNSNKDHSLYWLSMNKLNNVVSNNLLVRQIYYLGILYNLKKYEPDVKPSLLAFQFHRSITMVIESYFNGINKQCN